MSESSAQLERERQKLSSVQQIARATGSIVDLDELLHLIVSKITELMEAERSTLYLTDEAGTELWTKVLQAEELQEIRLRVGEGVAGWVAEHGQTVNIEDAYADERFAPGVDQRTGYRTRSILCMPMRDQRGATTGVIQVLNKTSGASFTREDEELLEALVSQASIAVENSKLYRSVVKKNEQFLAAQRDLERRVRELDLLLQLEQNLRGTHSEKELLEQLLASTAELIGAEAASMLLADAPGKRLYFHSALGERSAALEQLSVAMGEGIAGWVAQHGEPALVSDPARDPRHNRTLAERVGFQPRNILCVPLVGNSARGAIELLNKVDRDSFDVGDLRLLSIVAGRAAQAIDLARMHEEQEKEDRLAAIGQMMSGVLHDLKTPMTIISGYAQLMAHSEEQEVREEYVAQILRQFDLMAAMTREVLAFARGESKALFRKVYLYKFMREVSEQLRHEFAGREIELVLNNNYEGVAYFDEAKLRRVVHNIGRNAAQAMPDGGRFEIGVDADDERLTLTFSDTGGGVPAEIEGRLFEMFATAGREGGTGLGLAIVKKIVEEHGGQISYRSTPEQGTTFTIEMPLVRERGSTGEVVLGSSA